MTAVARILSHPFRLAPNGFVASVDQDTDVADSEQIAVLILTVRGERALVPGFGIPDPTWDGFQPGDVAAALAVYGPPRELVDITVAYETDTAQVVDVVYR